MRITSLLIAAMLTATAPIVPLATYANAQSHDDSDRARNHLASGRTMSLREIEQSDFKHSSKHFFLIGTQTQTKCKTYGLSVFSCFSILEFSQESLKSIR